MGNGPDVAEPDRNLIALGYATGLLASPDDVWTAAATAAVEHWQHAVRLPVTGEIELGPSQLRHHLDHVILSRASMKRSS